MNQYQNYLGWGLNNFEDFLEAFTKYKDGGCWLRKIDYKDAFYREITEGPYSKKEANQKALEWNKIFQYKGLVTAKVYNLLDLLCHHKDDYLRLKDHLYSEYIWRPPNGSELFCIIKGDRKVVLYKDSEVKKDLNLEKFTQYAMEKAIKKIELKGYKIYYKGDDYISVERAKKLKKLVIDYHEEPKLLEWLYLEAINSSPYREGEKPIVTPDYILNFKKDIVPQSLDFFKKLKNYEGFEEKIRALFRELQPYRKKLLTKNNDYILAYTLPLIYDEKDSNIKNINFSYNNKTLEISVVEIDYNIKLDYNPIREGKLFFEFPYTKELDFFDDSLIDLLIFIAKILNIDRIVLKDNLKEYCKCNGLNNMPLYLNIIRFLADEESIYKELGFVEEGRENRVEILKKYQEKLVHDDPEDVYTYKDLAQDYFKGFCKYSYACELLNNISGEIFEKLRECCLEYNLELSNLKLFKLKERLTAKV